MQAERCADAWLQVRGPAEAWRIHETLDAAVASPDDIDGHAPDLMVVGALDACE
jgi:hypothetical protein